MWFTSERRPPGRVSFLRSRSARGASDRSTASTQTATGSASSTRPRSFSVEVPPGHSLADRAFNMTQQGGHQGECSRRKRRVSSLFSGEVEPTAGACALGVRSQRLGQHTVQEVGEAREEGVREARGEAEYTQADVGREAEAPLG